MRGTSLSLILGLGAILLGLAALNSTDSDDVGAVRAGETVGLEERAPIDVRENEDPADYARDYAEFGTQLGLFCAGDDAALTALRRAARTFAEEHGRTDALDVVEYYAGLTRSERLLGQSAYDEFVGIWQALREHPDNGWDEGLEDFREQLYEFAARVMPNADFVPAGRALALAAEIEVQWLEYLEAQKELRTDVLQSAERNLRESIAIFERAGMMTPQLQPLWLQGRLEILEGNDDLARRRFEQCRRLATTTRVDDYRERALIRLVRLARGSGDIIRSRELLEDLATFRSPSDCWELAREYAMLLIHRDEPDLAAEFLIRHRPNVTDDLDGWRFTLAVARLRMDEHASARELMARLSRKKANEDALLLAAQLDLQERDSAAVLDALDRPESELPRLSERGRSHAAMLIGWAHHLEGRPQEALLALARSRRIADSWEARLEKQSALEGTSAAVMGEWLGLHAVVLEASALVALGREFEAVLVIERSHSLSWRSAARDDSDAASALSKEDLLEWAGHFEHGLITWISGADSGLAIHVDAKGVAQGFGIDHSRKELVRAARRLRDALVIGDEALALRLSEELTAELFPESLLQSLREAGDADGRLLCLAHGELERLPLEALVVEGVPLDALAAVLVLPELPEARPGVPPGEELEWRLLGSPQDARGFESLPGAAAELDELRRQYPRAISATGREFRSGELIEAIRSGDALHLATHTRSAGRCRSDLYAAVGLELDSGQVLCAEEIADLCCRSPLVVLAACETAEGRQLDSRGLQGISRAFLRGGTRDLLVTLWPIRDDVAQRFTLLFHAGLQSGLGPARAAQSARRRLDEDGVRPADWAAFRVLGRD